MKTVYTIGVLLILAIACFLLFRGCGDSKALQKIEDSLRIERALNDTIKLQNSVIAKANDSIMVKNHTDSTKFVSKIDSLSKVVAGYNRRLKITKDSIGSLYANLKTFYLDHDTVALYRTYAELQTQLTQANQMLFAVQIARDSSDNTRDAEIARLNGLIPTLQGQISELQGLLVSCTTNASNLAKNGELALKKAKASGLFAKIGAGIAGVIVVLLLLVK